MYGVSKPFSDTCYGHGNIPLRVEGSLDLARRCTVVSPLLFSLVFPVEFPAISLISAIPAPLAECRKKLVRPQGACSIQYVSLIYREMRWNLEVIVGIKRKVSSKVYLSSSGRDFRGAIPLHDAVCLEDVSDRVLERRAPIKRTYGLTCE